MLRTAQVFRGLRLWHAHPTPCSGCRQPLGAYSDTHTHACGSCSKVYSEYNALRDHVKSTGHKQDTHHCGACGRLHSARAAAEAVSSAAEAEAEAEAAAEAVALAAEGAVGKAAPLGQAALG